MDTQELYWLVDPVRRLTDEELLAALKNVGCDLECGTCAEIFFTGGSTGNPHTCLKGNKTRRMIVAQNVDAGEMVTTDGKSLPHVDVSSCSSCGSHAPNVHQVSDIDSIKMCRDPFHQITTMRTQPGDDLMAVPEDVKEFAISLLCSIRDEWAETGNTGEADRVQRIIDSLKGRNR